MIEAAPVEWRDSPSMLSKQYAWLHDPYAWLVDVWTRETGGDFDPNPFSDDEQIDYAQAIAVVSHDDIMEMIEEIVLDPSGEWIDGGEGE